LIHFYKRLAELLSAQLLRLTEWVIFRVQLDPGKKQAAPKK